MASTQTLTELPSIQYTGMDYSSTISAIKSIIQDDKNWAQNWTQFYSSQAGTLLIELMSWICDNLGVRQDLIFNEQFLATASQDSSKRRLLNQIGYVLESPSAAIVPIAIEFDNVTENNVELSVCREDEDIISDIANTVFRFYGKDINGANTTYEVLSVNSDGTINYTTPIKLTAGNAYYTTDADGNQLTAVEGKTMYREFTSDVSDGPVFELTDSDIDLKTLVVYDVTDNENLVHVKVDNFLDTSVTNGTLPVYVVEMNDDGNYQIRYPNEAMVTYGSTTLSDRLFTAGHTIGVLYRTTSGADGNIEAEYLSSTDSVTDINDKSYSITITNILSGYNGEDGEELEDAVLNAPLTLTTMNRAVTIDDYDRILKKSDLVLNCKSFSPENMPTTFSDYYGRKINPQEIFSFLVLNKNFNSISTSHLNYFPWIELNKESIVNEKYVFGGASMNELIGTSNSTKKNIYIKDDYDEFTKTAYYGSENDSGSDNGKWQYKHYDLTTTNASGDSENFKARMIRNVKLYETSDLFHDTIANEKTEKIYQMKIKLNSSETDSLYIDKIKNSFLNTYDDITVENNILTLDTNATYTSLKTFSRTGTIDCKKLKYIRFVLDDNNVITVDLQKEMVDLSDYTSDTTQYTAYYLMFDNTPSATSDSYISSLEDTYTKGSTTYNKKVLEYYSSEDFAEYRKGILQLLREACNEYFDFTVVSSTDAAELLKIKTGTLVSDVNKETSVYKYNDEYYAVSGDNILKIVGNSSSYTADFPSLEQYAVTDQQYIERSTLSNGTTAFVDLNLQSSSLTDDKEYISNSYIYEQDNTNYYYGTDDIGYFYRININGNIYAIRLDGYSVKKANEYYKSLAETSGLTGSSSYYDYYSYIGKGDLITDLGYDSILSQSSNGTKYATISKEYNGLFSRKIISGTIINSGKAIHKDGDNITSVGFQVGQLATTLEYIFSPLNMDSGIIYRYINEGWYDIKATSDSDVQTLLGLSDITSDENIEKIYEFRNVLNGKLAVEYVEKANYDVNNCIRLSSTNVSNNYLANSNSEYDIRFRYINGYDDLELSSVSEREITKDIDLQSNIIETVKVNDDYETKDFFGEVFGYRKQFSASPVDYTDKGNEVATLVKNGSEYNLKISSLAEGEQSSLYFVQTASTTGCEIMEYFGLTNEFDYSMPITLDSTYYERARSDKAFGVRRLELYVGDDESNSTQAYIGIPSIDVNDLTGADVTTSETFTITAGDILLTDSDINYSNATDLYVSYVLEDATQIAINKYDNFYYSSNETANEAAKPDIVGIEGEGVNIDSDGNYIISSDKSNFYVKITADEVDTNSYYAIEEDTINELGIIKNGPTVVETFSMNNSYIDDDNFYKENGLGYGIANISKEDIIAAGKMEVPLVMSIDGLTQYCAQNNATFIYQNSKDYVLVANPGTVIKATGASLYTKLRAFAKTFTSDIVDVAGSYNSIIKKGFNSDNKLVISGIDSSSTGNVTFYYPDSTIETDYFTESDYQKGEDYYDLSVQLFYKKLFGTSVTNPEFYALYPKDKMIADGLNDNEVVCSLSSDSDEYFYCPTKKHHLRFVYRAYLDESKTSSKFGDYYVSAECKGDKGFTDGYNFYLNKTDYSEFPDAPFYLHFVNDRTYEYKRTSGDYQTEEDCLREYMDSYKLTGTDIYFLKPYFKGFDIVATISYNANYDLATIKSNVETALQEKYYISSIDDISIGNSVHRSDIYRVILNIDGVESVDITYFGYDYTNQSKYPDQKYSLNITTSGNSKAGTEFYMVSVLNETSAAHGLIFTYEKADTESVE